MNSPTGDTVSAGLPSPVMPNLFWLFLLAVVGFAHRSFCNWAVSQIHYVMKCLEFCKSSETLHLIKCLKNTDCTCYQVVRKGRGDTRLVPLSKKRRFVAQHPKLLLRQLRSILILLLFKVSYPSLLSLFVFANMECYSQRINRKMLF